MASKLSKTGLICQETSSPERCGKAGAVMKKWFERIPMVFGIWGCVLATAWGESTTDPEVGAAVQAIQQAPDPSAAVAAYANGAALDRNDPKLSEAYVARMVDLGLPELAFRQRR